MMNQCDSGKATPTPCCSQAGAAPVGVAAEHLAHFANMIQHCLDYATQAKRDGLGIIGIMCEFTPRELILAAGAVPVCLCGGSAKTIPAAEADLPANLCPLIKSTYGYHTLGNNPFLEMADAVVAETTCDGKKKMYELMGRTRRMIVLELPHKPNDPDARDHWLAQLRMLRRELETLRGVEITDDKLRRAIALMNRERRLRRALAELMAGPHPPLTGRELLTLKSSISGIEGDLAHYERALAKLADAPPRGDAASKVRVLLTGVPIPHGAERVLDIIENAQGLVVCMENCTGIKPLMEDVDESAPDPMNAIAETYFHLGCSVMTPNDTRLMQLEQQVARYRPACIIELVWQACLTYDVESARVRELAERLGLPYLRIETDYSPSDSARVAVRVEALFEAVRATPAARTGADSPPRRAGATMTHR